MESNTFAGWRCTPLRARAQRFIKAWETLPLGQEALARLYDDCDLANFWAGLDEHAHPLAGLPLIGYEAWGEEPGQGQPNPFAPEGMVMPCFSRCEEETSSRQVSTCRGSLLGLAAGLAPLALAEDTHAALRIAASEAGSFAFRLGGGLLPTGPRLPTKSDYHGFGWMTAGMQDLLEAGRAWGGGCFLDGAVEPNILDLSQASYSSEQQAGSIQLPAGLQGIHAVRDPELDACIRKRLQGCARALHILASRQWVHGMMAEKPGLLWTESEVSAAHQVEHTVANILEELFQNYDVLIFPMDYSVDGQRPGEFSAAVSLARLPSMIIPISIGDGKESSVQLVFPDMERVSGISIPM